MCLSELGVGFVVVRAGRVATVVDFRQFAAVGGVALSPCGVLVSMYTYTEVVGRR